MPAKHAIASCRRYPPTMIAMRYLSKIHTQPTRGTSSCYLEAIETNFGEPLTGILLLFSETKLMKAR